jgi:hypothetical protein
VALSKLKRASSIKIATIIELDIPVDSYVYSCITRIMSENAELEYLNRCIKAIIEKDNIELLKLYQ